MFHHTKFGKFGDSLPADLDGNVPEEGDDWREMNWDHGGEDISDAAVAERLDRQWWPAVVAEAVQKSVEATAALKKWKQINASRIL